VRFLFVFYHRMRSGGFLVQMLNWKTELEPSTKLS
jgi:hypothetical protein